MAEASTAKIQDFGAQSLGNTAWAFAKRSMADEKLLNALSVTARAKIKEMRP